MYSFPIQETEWIVKKGHASLSVEGNAFSGALYLTNERLVFIGYLLSLNRKYMEEVPLEHITELKLEKTFFIIPNAFSVVTIRGRILKIIISKRDEWINAINKQLTQIDGSTL